MGEKIFFSVLLIRDCLFIYTKLNHLIMRQYIIKHTVLFAIFLIFSSLTAQNQISGVVTYHQDTLNLLPDVTLELFDTGDNLVATTMSNNIGEFDFSNIPSGEYFLRSSTMIDVGDINLIDASLVLQHLNGTYTLNDHEFLAADVNGSGNVTNGDYMILTNSYLLQGNPFPAGEWQFEEVYIDLTSRGDYENVVVWGTATGDVEGVWMPAGRNLDILPEEIQNATAVNEQEIELEIGSSYSDLISGFNLNLTYPVNLIEITDVSGPDENFYFNLNENTGVLKVIWLDENDKPGNKFFGETLFRVKVKQIQNSTRIEEGVFSLLEGGMVLDSRSDQINNIGINLPKVTTTSTKLEFELTGYPNPVANNLNLKITSPTNNYANIYIYDLVGRLVKETINTSIYKGTQLINLNTESLPSGHYLYKVDLQGIENISGRFYKTN